jgi:adenylyltransferase/sulfurtransferase
VTPPDAASGIPGITPAELKERMDLEQPLVLLDVREGFERDIADLPDVGQRHIPLGQLPQRVHELDPSEPVVVYCRTGNRSAWAVQFLRERGFESIWNLTGGIMAWREEVDPSLQAY